MHNGLLWLEIKFLYMRLQLSCLRSPCCVFLLRPREGAQKVLTPRPSPSIAGIIQTRNGTCKNHSAKTYPCCLSASPLSACRIRLPLFLPRPTRLLATSQKWFYSRYLYWLPSLKRYALHPIVPPHWPALAGPTSSRTGFAKSSILSLL